MIKSSGIKKLCYAVMGISCMIGVLLVIIGIYLAVEMDMFVLVMVSVLGFFVPFLTTVSLYPIFALASIEENVAVIKDAFASLPHNIAKQQCEEYHNQKSTEVKSSEPRVVYKTDSKEDRIRKYDGKLPDDLVEFFRNKYGIAIDIQDDFETIKRKINEINQATFTALILKNKINDATNMDEIFNVLIMHKVANG